MIGHVNRMQWNRLTAIAVAVWSCGLVACSSAEEAPALAGYTIEQSGNDVIARGEYDMQVEGVSHLVSSVIRLQRASRGDYDVIDLTLEDNLLKAHISVVEEQAVARFDTISGAMELQARMDDSSVAYNGTPYYGEEDLQVALRDDPAFRDFTMPLEAGMQLSAEAALALSENPDYAADRGKVGKFFKRVGTWIFNHTSASCTYNGKVSCTVSKQ